MDKSYFIKDISVMYKIPSMRRINQNDRRRAAFLYIINGSYIFRTKEGSFKAGSGDAVYIPKHSHYSLEILSENTEGIMVDFNLETEGKSTIISEIPIAFPVNSNVFYEMLTHFYKEEQFGVLEKLFGIISLFEAKAGKKDTFGKIKPAVEFIETNFSKDVSSVQLSALCGLSQSHFRRLFAAKTGMSPVKYKNKILIKHACNLIKSGDMNISEVAETLNFCSIYAFSRAFKKEMGVSPKKYSEQQ